MVSTINIIKSFFKNDKKSIYVLMVIVSKKTNFGTFRTQEIFVL
jgi:hypothetical protein